ncbi:hypothetical protein Taro_020096, partial [Colocasia esculenta]|nr:hypothetical protein [Colocasia esculenta]
SVTPSVVTSSVGSPRFQGEPSTWVCSGLSRYSGTVRVLSSSWTPSLSRRVVVRLRERLQGQRLVRVCCLVACSALVVGGTDISRRTRPQLVLFPVPHFRELGPESLKVLGMGLRDVWWFGWSPQFLFGLVERQLDLSSVAARLRGRPVCLSGLVAGVVRESRRLPIRLLVLDRTAAEQGLRHHQQCNFLSLYTSGMPQTCVNDIPCEASARSREAESCQTRYQEEGKVRRGCEIDPSPSHPIPPPLPFGERRMV